MARKKNTTAPPVGRCKANLYSRGVSNITDSGVFKNYLDYKEVRVLEGDRYGEPHRFHCWRPKGSDRIYIKQLKIEMGNMARKRRKSARRKNRSGVGYGTTDRQREESAKQSFISSYIERGFSRNQAEKVFGYYKSRGAFEPLGRSWRYSIKRGQLKQDAELRKVISNPSAGSSVVGLIIVGLFGYFIGQRSISTMRNISLNRRY